MRIARKKFEELVWEAVDGLPPSLKNEIRNVEIDVAYEPDDEDYDIADAPDDTELFGLYEGIPLTERTSDYMLVPPDLITIFQRPHEDACDTHTQLRDEVRRTVRHEIAHYFGISDERLEELGAY